ncbi:MAG: uncharacterized protein KVP18_001532 [Porospora cf. gigantea A]|uniref:uncharacterized protein n=1 Tax=Porospora cf. gigantea A TaxID=2853593 RepID=UPI00355A4F58|nr:MAG: hypothetical protein KVP18_001532 [Porospora cf. gigantea A]
MVDMTGARQYCLNESHSARNGSSVGGVASDRKSTDFIWLDKRLDDFMRDTVVKRWCDFLSRSDRDL